MNKQIKPLEADYEEEKQIKTRRIFDNPGMLQNQRISQTHFKKPGEPSLVMNPKEIKRITVDVTYDPPENLQS